MLKRKEVILDHSTVSPLFSSTFFAVQAVPAHSPQQQKEKQIVEWLECPEQTELRRRRCGRLRFSRRISKRVWSPEPPVDTSAAHRWPTLVWTRLQFSRSNSKCSWTKGLLRSTSSCIRDAPPWQRGASLEQNLHQQMS